MRQKPFLNEVHYKSDNVITTLSGGISNIYPASFIADDEVQEMSNMCLDFYPGLRTKVGRTMVKNPGVAGQKIQYFEVAGLNYLFYIQNSILKDHIGNAIASEIKGDTFSHVYYKDGNHEYLILYGDEIAPTRHMLPLSSLNEPELVPVLQEDGLDIEFEHMCYHKGRMFASNGDMLYFSALQNPMDWTTAKNSGYIKVTNAMGKITGLVSFDDKLVIFSQNNMHILYGDTVSADGTSNFNLVDLNNGIGAYDQNAMKVHKGYLYWLYASSIYEYDGSSIRNIEKPTSNNGVTGGIQQYLDGIIYTEAQNVSIAGSDTKVYFYFPDYYGRILIFDQRLRKWTQEFQPDIEKENYYIRIASSFNSLNYSQTPEPVYALTANGVIYELTGGKREGSSFSKIYGQEECINDDGLVYRKETDFYLKSKKFNESGISKKKSLKELWFYYDLAENAEATIQILTDTKQVVLEKALPSGTNKVECVLIPHHLGSFNNYTIVFSGKGDIMIKQMERKFRIKTR